MLPTAIIAELGVEKADAKIGNKLKLAKMLSFTDTPNRASNWKLNFYAEETNDGAENHHGLAGGMPVLADEKQCELQEYNFSVNQWCSKDAAPWPRTRGQGGMAFGMEQCGPFCGNERPDAAG